MVLALVVVPMVAYTKVGGVAGIHEAVAAKNIATGLIPHGGAAALLGVFSAMAWGLGCFGQPHILVRFMIARSPAGLSRSAVIAIVWAFISRAGAVVIGLIAIGLFETPPDGDKESPHITLGYGQAKPPFSFPVAFAAARLALCHLGNHCTCRKVLASCRLSGR